MKNKRLLTWILAVAMLVVTLCFAACVQKPKVITLEELDLPELAEDEMVVVEKVGEEKYKYFVITLNERTGLSEESSLLNVLEYLRDNSDVTLELNNGFINKFDQLPHEGAQNEYVYLYTSVEKDFDQSAYVTTYDCDGVIVKTSAVGCAEMSIQKGCVIYIDVIVWVG